MPGGRWWRLVGGGGDVAKSASLNVLVRKLVFECTSSCWIKNFQSTECNPNACLYNTCIQIVEIRAAVRLRQFGNFHWVESTLYTKTKCSDYIQKVLSMTSCPKLCLKFVNKVLLGRWKRETVWLWLFQHQNDVDHRYPRSLQTRFSRQWRKGDFTVKNVMDRFQTEGLECEMLGKCDSYQDFAPDGFISQRYSNKTDGDTVNSNIRYTAIV